MTSVLKRYRRESREEGRESHEKTEADMKVMQPRAEGGLGPPEAGRGQEALSPRALGGSTAL